MLSKEQNELLCRIEPGTTMGDTLRQFWLPAVRSAKLEADGTPERVRMLGQNFVAFRDTNGRIGFMDEGCPHRGVSLALGRNEECGLRCIFHGWKFDVEGNVIDIPSEPPGSNLASKIRVHHYPVREEAGVVWVWLGQEGQPSPFPAFDFVNHPIENMVPRKAIVNCNWVALLEGLLDSSHVSSLHKDWLPSGKETLTGPNAGMMGALSVNYEIEEQPYGYKANAKRLLANGTQVNRKTEYILPVFCMIPSTLKTLRGVAVIVPIDDEHTNFWTLAWDTAGPIDAPTVDKLRNVGRLGKNPDDIYEPHLSAAQMWGQDRDAMKKGTTYAGLTALPIEDFVISESQGKIVDRSMEKLGASDIAIIRMRKLLLDLAKDYKEGRKPAILTQEIDYGQIRPVHEVLAPSGEQIEVHV